MTGDEAKSYASVWAAAWNERDVDRVVGLFSDDITFTSPTALAVVGAATVRGKAALREYWSKAMSGIRSLHFSIDRVLWDAAARELAILYRAEIDGRARRVSENLTFGPDGLVIRAEVFHGVSA